MKENKEELINIGQEQINKAVELFEGKALDALDFLTWQFKNDFASDIDYKLKGYKKDFEKLNQNYCQLIRENEQLKSEQKKVAVEKLEECKLISNEYNICSCCGYNLNNLIKEIVVGCDTDDCECGNAVVHQVFWTDKYMNYCPNCGAKIKRGESDE